MKICAIAKTAGVSRPLLSRVSSASPPSSFSVYFHVHPSIGCVKRKSGVLLEIPGDKKMFFSYKGGKLRFEKSTYIGNFFEPQEITRLVIEKNVEQSDSKINWKIEEFID